ARVQRGQANTADPAPPGRWCCPLEGERRSRYGGGPSILIKLGGAALRVVDQLALLRRRLDRVALEAHAAGLLQVGKQCALLLVEMQERVAAQIEDAGLLLAQTLDLAQLPQQRQQSLQRVFTGVGHDVVLQKTRILRPSG